MKTAITNQKNNFKKLTKVLGIGILMSLGLEANSQCIAHYTSVEDSVITGNVIFTGTSSGLGGLITWFWDFGDSATSSLENPNHVFAAGAYEVCLTVADQSGNNCTYCGSVVVGNPNGGGCAPNFYSYFDSISSPNMVNFWNASAGTPSSFLWDFGDSTFSTLENPIHVYVASGTYQVCLTIDNSCATCDAISCTHCENVIVGNENTNGCQAYFYADSSSASSNTINFFNYSTGNPNSTSYLWDFGDNTTSSLENPIHTYANIGTYQVCLTMVDSMTNCAPVTYCENVVVGNTTNCNTTFSNYNDSTNSNLVTFYSTTSFGTGPYTYSWSFGDSASTSNLPNPQHQYPASGGYFVCLTVTDNNGTTCSFCNIIGVGTATSACNSNFTNTISGNTATFVNNAVGGTNHYWYFGDGSTGYGQSATHTYANAGTYTVCFDYNFYDSTNAWDTCQHCETIVVGNTGVQEQTTIISSFENYPNPFSDNTTIAYSIKQDGNIELSIVDLIGNKIAVIDRGNKSAGNYSTVWNVEHVAEGMYLLQLKVNNSVSTKKIIISK